MPVEVFANVAESTLSVAALSTDATLTLLSGAPFPSAGQYRVRLDDSLQQSNGIATRYEICRATFNAGNVVNGYRTGADLEGTTAQAWPIGTKVVAIVTAAALANLIAPLPLGAIATATRTTPQGSITSPAVDLTGLTITATTIAGRRYKISSMLPNLSSTISNDHLSVSLIKDGAYVTDMGTATMTSSGLYGVQCSGFFIDTPTAAAHTYKLIAVRDAGTGTFTINNTTTRPSQLILEDIGV